MFKDELNEFIRLISDPESELDEWYLSDFKDEHIWEMQSYEAFSCLREAVPYLFAYPRYGYELLEIISALKETSDTTELFYEPGIVPLLIDLYKEDSYHGKYGQTDIQMMKGARAFAWRKRR